jgi:hypothetical protein
MKKKFFYTKEVEINLVELIRQFWKEKILILFVSGICTLLASFYLTFTHTQKKELQTTITLQIPSVVIIEKYKDFLKIDVNYDSNNSINNNNNNNNNINSYNTDALARYYLNILKIKLLSIDNLKSFVEQSREFHNFKVFLKERNITINQYFSEDRFGITKKKNQQVSNEFFFNFNEELLDGPTFLNNYVEFTKDKIANDIQNTLKQRLLNAIEKNEQAFEIANQIKLESPILQSMTSGSSVVNEPASLFYLGTKVLSQQNKYYRKLFLELQSEKLNFEFVLDKASSPTIQASFNFRVWMGLIFGFFFSLVIIFFKKFFFLI